MSHTPRKRFGQNFLRDKSVVDRIVHSLGLSPQDRVLEIGPGEGALTSVLLEAGAQVDAIEIDRDLALLLEKRFGSSSRFRLHVGDVLRFDFSSMAEAAPLRVVGNLPYNISTPLMFHLFQKAGLFSEMVFMLQREVVDRLCADAGDGAYGRLSIMARYYARAERLFDVGPESFFPMPKVHSSIVRLVPHPVPPVDADPSVLGRLVSEAFMQRRKTLRNALRHLADESLLLEAGIDPSVRAETLFLEDYAGLARVFLARQGGLGRVNQPAN